MSNAADHFVICFRNEGYPASLETRKVYQEIPDPDAAKQSLIRVIDESGEDDPFPPFGRRGMKRILVGIGLLLATGSAVVWAGNDLFRLFESDEPSRSIGRPADGRLEHGKRLPSRGPNFRTYSRLGSLLGRTSVHADVRAAVLDAYARIRQTRPDLRFVFGETGWPSGGRIRPHRTHQNGLSVDFMVPVRRSGRLATLPTWPWTKFGYGIEFDGHGRGRGLEIDFEAVALHLESLREAAHAHGLEIAVVIFAPELQQELFRTEAGGRIRRQLRFSQRPAWVRHDEHYHVDFRLRS